MRLFIPRKENFLRLAAESLGFFQGAVKRLLRKREGVNEEYGIQVLC